QSFNLQILKQLFQDDHNVRLATSGQQALDACEQALPDLILLDVVMPGMDGHQVCTRLKANPKTRDVPVIFVTGRNDPEEESEGLALGAADFISKPVNASVVRARVRGQLLLRQSLRDIRDLNENLEARVQQRTEELEQAMETIRQSQEQLARSEAHATLSTLIASVSHEMGTPLGNANMVTSTLFEDSKAFQAVLQTGKLSRSGLEQYVQGMVDGTTMLAANLERAVELLRDFHQVASDQASGQLRTFDLADTVSEVLHTLRPSLKRHPHRIDVSIPPGIKMNSEPGALGQVLINLINNAYLHAFEGRSNGVLTISAHVCGSEVELTVADNGIGMPADRLDKLFQPFFSTKIGQGGTGLGMLIVQNLLTKKLGGRIAVQSAEGLGTLFRCTIPL
ncbi:MAG: ATP-binding protein, partial [Burkholderiaceae bacterium]